MKPEEIKAGHTYETKSGHHARAISVDVTTVCFEILPIRAVSATQIHLFAAACVRDVNPAPEPHQGEKVAQAQSHGPSRGDSLAKLTADDWMQIEMAAKGCVSGRSNEWPALVAAINKIRSQPLSRPMSAAWLQGFCEAAIARAEAANDPPRFRHRRTGDIYELLLIANEHAERTAQYPPTAVYRRVSDQTVWSRPVQDWGKDFEEVVGE